MVFIIDGSDDSRFEEVRTVIDDLYSRQTLDDAGMPKIEKRKVDKDKAEEMVDVDLEGGPGGDEKSTEEILK